MMPSVDDRLAALELIVRDLRGQIDAQRDWVGHLEVRYKALTRVGDVPPRPDKGADRLERIEEMLRTVLGRLPESAR